MKLTADINGMTFKSELHKGDDFYVIKHSLEGKTISSEVCNIKPSSTGFEFSHLTAIDTVETILSVSRKFKQENQGMSLYGSNQ